MFHEDNDGVLSPLDFFIGSRLSDNYDQKELISIRTNPTISLESFDSHRDPLLWSKYYNEEEKRSTFSNISVKVQTQIYHLDKLMLALNSGYFEKLLVEGYEGKECSEIEIHAIDEETFLFIVEHIYGVEMRRNRGKIVIELKNRRNFAKIFMAMNYLQMEINLEDFQYDIEGASWSNLDEIPAEIFKMYNFVSPLPQFKPISFSFRKCFSQHFLLIGKTSEFLSLSPHAVVDILSLPRSSYYNSSRNKSPLREEHLISKICAEWICHDFQNRLPRIIDLVNAAKRRFGISFAISSENYEAFEERDEIKRKRMVEKYFSKLLKCSAEIDCEPATTTVDTEKSNEGKPESRKTVVYKIYREAKWMTFVKRKYFSDVSIRVRWKVFHLHRLKLSLEVPYFYDLFSQSTVQTEYSLDATIDCATFRNIVNYIYHGKIDVINESQLARLLNACKILRMEQLSEKIFWHVLVNLDKLKSSMFDFLNYVLENENFSEHSRILDAYMGHAWDVISKESKFYEISFDMLEHLITLPDLRLKTEQDLLNVCTKWIHHDVQNRYRLIPELAFAINRNSMVDHEKYSSLLPKVSGVCAEEYILKQLNSILSLTEPVSSRTRTLATIVDSCEEPTNKPCFVISKGNVISILDENLNEIFSLHSPDKFQCSNLSAAIVEDNLFLLFSGNTCDFLFQSYSLKSKKIISLSTNLKFIWSKVFLLNCNNTLYYCDASNREDVFSKYSCKLNRWITAGFKTETEAKHFYQCYYTSNGKDLFKVIEESGHNYVVQLYNFEKKLWVNLPHLTIPEPTRIQDVSIIDEGLSVLFHSCTAIYRQENQGWEIVAHNNEKFTTFKQVEDAILYVSSDGQVNSFSIANKSWQSLKKLERFDKIVAIR